jgi:hypothetical protein
MNQARLQSRLLIGVCALAGIAIVGCGGGGTVTVSVSPTPSTPTATATSPSATTTATATATHTPTPTATSVSATPTPTPVPLVGQVVTVGFGTVHSGTNSQILDATCPAGYLVAGGGFNSGYTSFTIMQDEPISTTQWRGEIFNTGSSDIYAQLQVVCLKLSGMVGQVVTVGFPPVHSGTNSSIVLANCPSGYLVAGGGISSGYTSFTLMQDEPQSTTQWWGEIHNTGAGDIYAQLQIMCLRASGLAGQVLAKSLGSAGTGSNSTIIDQTCPAGYLVAGGGVNSGYSTQTVMQNEPISTTQWQSEIFNHGDAPITAQTQIECLTHA